MFSAKKEAALCYSCVFRLESAVQVLLERLLKADYISPKSTGLWETWGRLKLRNQKVDR